MVEEQEVTATRHEVVGSFSKIEWEWWMEEEVTTRVGVVDGRRGHHDLFFHPIHVLLACLTTPSNSVQTHSAPSSSNTYLQSLPPVSPTVGFGH